MKRALLGIVLALGLHPVCASPAPAPYTVDLVGVEGSIVSGEVTLKAEPVGGEVAAARPEPISRFVEVPGKARLPLGEGGIWRLSVESSTLWAAAEVVTPKAGDSETALRLHPTGWIEGQLQAEAGEKPPKALEARFQSSPGEASGSDIRESTAPCEVDDGRFRCTLPAGRLDLRLQSRGFIPKYRWGVRIVARHGREMGALWLEHGASITGEVVIPRGVDHTSIEVLLKRLRGAPSSNAADLMRRKAFSTAESVNERGFFHFDGVFPASYKLVVRGPSGRSGSLSPVTVRPNEETSLPEPVVLREPVALTLSLDPPLDLYQRPWLVRFFQVGETPGSVDELASRRARPDGTFRKGDLEPGRYRLSVSDSRGNRMVDRDLDLETDTDLQIPIDIVPVVGKVSLGGRPLAAELYFGGKRGSVSIEMKADEKGAFAGSLPREGRWALAVEAADPPVHRNLRSVLVERKEGQTEARLRLDLPDTSISGEVVTDEGDAVAGATVSIVELDEGAPEQQKADEEGRFEVHGLPLADISVLAEGPSAAGWLSSEAVLVHLSKQQPTADLRLVVRPTLELRGHVLSPAGSVVGARVIAMAFGAGGRPISTGGQQATTSVDGSFSLEVPASSAKLDLIVLAPGFALESSSLRAPFVSPIEVQVASYGGTLRLALPEVAAEEEGRSPLATRPVVIHDGVLLDSSLLSAWALLNARPSETGGEVVVENLAPGSYTACLWSTAEEIRYYYHAMVPGGTACEQGFLQPRGDLTLKLSAAEKSARGSSRVTH